MEPIELLRRMSMIGLVSLCGTGATRSAIAVFFALCSVFIYREVQPFSDRSTNVLAYVAQWVVFFVFLAAFIIEVSEETQVLGYDNDNPATQLCLGVCCWPQSSVLSQQQFTLERRVGRYHPTPKLPASGS